jgi:tetratricopeptide (TPR) repeat protein
MTARILSVLTFVLVCASLSIAQTTASDFYSKAVNEIATRNYDGAIADLTKAIALNYSPLGEAYLVRGVVKKKKRDLDGAWDDATESIRLLDNAAAGYSLRGEIEFTRNELDEAINEFSKAIKEDPKDFRPYRQRALARKESGDMDGAIADLTKAIEMNPAYESYIDRGSIFLEKGAKRLAFADFDKAVQIAPGNIDVYLNRANARFLDKDYDLATADLEKALTMNPKSVDVYHLLGHVYIEKGHIASAVASFTKAIELAPSVAHYYVDRAVTISRNGNHQKAIDDISKAIELFPRDPDFYRMRAWTNLYLGNNEAVYGDATAALKLGGLKDLGAYSVMSGYIALRKEGKSENARVFLSTWIKEADENTWPVNIMQFLNGQMNASELLKAATDQGDLTEAHTFIGEVALINGERHTARSHFAWVRDNGSKISVQFPLAISELKKLDGSGVRIASLFTDKKGPRDSAPWKQ